MAKIMVKGINRVRRKLADGTVREYHYASRGRGAVPFWNDGMDYAEGSPEYLAALSAARPVAEKARGLFREILLAFMDSQDFKRLADRTRRDMKTSIFHPKNGIDTKFGDGPKAVFDDPRIRGVALKWRDGIGGKVGDDRIRHLQRIVGWALDRGALRFNHLRSIKSVYHSDRAQIFWLPDEIAKFEAEAPKHVSRIVVAICETGLRPGDLHKLTREHIHPTPGGQRIVFFTAKRKRTASIPVTPKMAKLIAETPKGQSRIITNQAGEPYKHANYLGDAVSAWRDKLGIRSDLHLYDGRGTAATRLLMAGADLKEIATAMGWSLKHAGEVIDRYAALSPEMSDGIAGKLAKLRGGS